MPTLVLICGLPGSGKTILAKQLADFLPALPSDSFRITKDQLDLWWGWFEPQTAEELKTELSR